MKNYFSYTLCFCICFFSAHAEYAQNECIKRGVPEKWTEPPFNIGGAVLETKQIKLDKFPQAFNPSILKISEGFLLVFRHCPYPKKLWVSHIGVVLLNDKLEQISEPILLKSRRDNDLVPPQGEDARIFSHNDKMYLIYNDNDYYENPSIYERRDMFIAELKYENGLFSLLEPAMLFHEKKYESTNWQKNWVPFSWNDKIFLAYSLLPHEILLPDFKTGECNSCYETVSPISWKWGTLRGGTPAILINGEYLAFFHSSTITRSIASKGLNMWHYYMGAYTFSAEPPFCITKMTTSPIIGNLFYSFSNFHKRVVFPGGVAVSDSLIYLAYGKDDAEMWIATIDYKKLKTVLVPLKK